MGFEKVDIGNFIDNLEALYALLDRFQSLTDCMLDISDLDVAFDFHKQ